MTDGPLPGRPAIDGAGPLIDRKVRIPAEHDLELQRLAAKHSTTISRIIRDAVALFIGRTPVDGSMLTREHAAAGRPVTGPDPITRQRSSWERMGSRDILGELSDAEGFSDG